VLILWKHTILYHCPLAYNWLQCHIGNDGPQCCIPLGPFLGRSASCCRHPPVIRLTFLRGCCECATWLLLLLLVTAEAASCYNGELTGGLQVCCSADMLYAG